MRQVRETLREKYGEDKEDFLREKISAGEKRIEEFKKYMEFASHATSNEIWSDHLRRQDNV